VVTFAQSFHWMDRRRVATAVRNLLIPGGAVVHAHATTHEGIDTDAELPHPAPPREDIARLVQHYLGAERRAGQGVLAAGTAEGEDAIYRTAGFFGPQRWRYPAESSIAPPMRSRRRSTRCPARPHLFGDGLEKFDGELRQLLAGTSPSGRFSEQMRSIALDVWRA
jgi:hypothetical protein